ncbi:N-acetyltransferase family protein [Propionibacteriaceae bacterium Y1700]|uniref:GNAT family N-acetyltransferase n=1 Tax=Microlunatus sp. Y1700 TaxID=3418487 RepID=UPI003DA6F343
MQSRVWKSSRAARVLGWVVIAAALAALASLAWILWHGLGQPAVAITLMVLAVACIVYMWRFALHPSLRLDDTIAVRNPLRTHQIPAKDVMDIVPGENGLQIRTADDLVEAWCVQKSTRAIKNRTSTRADRIVEEMLIAIDGVVGNAHSARSAASGSRTDDDHDELDDMTIRVAGGTVAAQGGQLATPASHQSAQTTTAGGTTRQSAISASSPQSAPVHHPHLAPGPVTPASATYPTSAASAPPVAAPPPSVARSGAGAFDERTDSPLGGPAPDAEVEDATVKRTDFDTLTLHAVPAEPAPGTGHASGPARALGSATDDDGDFEDEDADDLIIRRARLDDANLLAHLEQQASEQALQHIFGGRPFPFDDVVAKWVQVLGNWRNKVRIAEVDDQPVGYVAYGEGQVLHLGVIPQFTRRGFGRQLLDYATADIFRASPAAHLHVLVDNHVARAFYDDLGWQDTGERGQSDFPPHPTQMRLTLGRPRH